LITYSNLIIEHGKKLHLPIELNQYLNLADNELLRVKLESDYIVIAPIQTELDEEIFEELVHDGIVLEFK